LNVIALKQLRSDLVSYAEAVVRQANVKPGRGAAMLPHQLRVGAAQRGERFVESFAESFVHSAHRELSTVLLVGVSLRNRLGLIGGGELRFNDAEGLAAASRRAGAVRGRNLIVWPWLIVSV
jgi:hypothetical protein